MSYSDNELGAKSCIKIVVVLMATLLAAGLWSSLSETTTEVHEHIYNYELFYSDSQYHWNTCELCHEVINISKHTAACDSPDTCIICDHTTADGIVISDLSHYVEVVSVGDSRYYKADFDNTHCWYTCTKCGETVDTFEHEALCVSPDTCENCRHTTAEGIVISNISHKFEWVPVAENYYTKKVDFDNTHCWNTCLACGEAIDKIEHSALCVSPDTCENCRHPH